MTKLPIFALGLLAGAALSWLGCLQPANTATAAEAHPPAQQPAASSLPPLAPANPGNAGTDPARPPVLPFYHLWTGPDGLTRLDRCALEGFVQQSIGGGAAPQWLRPFPGEVESIKFAALPVGWTGEWHESPKPQWVITLTGRWFLETQSGQRVEMGPGQTHYGEDQGSRAVPGKGKGHRSGQVGTEPCVQLLVQFKTSPGAATACPPFPAP